MKSKIMSAGIDKNVFTSGGVDNYVFAFRKQSRIFALLIFALIAFESVAQSPVPSFRRVWLKGVTAADTTVGLSDGMFWHDEVSDELRVRLGGTTYSIGKGGASGFDSTKVWRTKSDFEVFGDRTITHDGLIMFQGQDAFNTAEFGPDYISLNSTNSGLGISGSTSNMSGSNTQLNIGSNTLFEAKAGGTTADFLVQGSGGNQYENFSVQTGTDNTLLLNNNTGFTSSIGTGDFAVTTNVAAGGDDILLVADGSTSNGEVNITDGLVQARYVDAAGTSKIEIHNFGMDIIVGATNDDLSLITNSGGDDIILSANSEIRLSANTSILSETKHFFTPTSTLSGFNSGSFAGDPSSLVNGDMWYNSTTNNLRARINGASVSLGQGTIGGTIAASQVGYGSGANTLTSEAAFSYNATNNTLSVDNITAAGRATFTATSTLPGLNVGSFAGNPSGPSTADIWYNSTAGTFIGRLSAVNANFVNNTAALTNNRIPIVSTGSTSTIGDDSDLTFTGGTTLGTVNLVATGRGTFTTTASLAGINVGSNDGAPSSLTNGDLFYDADPSFPYLGTRINGETGALLYQVSPAAASNNIPVFLTSTGRCSATTEVFLYTSGSDDEGLGIGQQIQGSEKLNLYQDDFANPVLRVATLGSSGTPSQAPKFQIFQERVVTTNATVTTIKTIAIPASTTVLVKATITARRTGGSAGVTDSGATYVLYQTFVNQSGSAVALGGPSTAHSAESDAAWNADFAVSGANALVRVTGATNNNITWNVTCEIHSVSD